MSFWNTFANESLYSPWLIRPESTDEQSLEPTQSVVCVVEPSTRQEAFEMLSKMILAMKFSPNEVAVTEVSDTLMESLTQWGAPKKLLFFGEEYPGALGTLQNVAGHTSLRTHSLNTLVEKPEFKKETWNHLKKFAGL